MPNSQVRCCVVLLTIAMLAILVWAQLHPKSAAVPDAPAGEPPDGGRCPAGTRWVARPSAEPSYNCGGYCVRPLGDSSCPVGFKRVPGLRGCAQAYKPRASGSCFAPQQLGLHLPLPQPPTGLACPTDTTYQLHTGLCVPSTDIVVRDKCPPGFEAKRWTSTGWSCYALPHDASVL